MRKRPNGARLFPHRAEAQERVAQRNPPREIALLSRLRKLWGYESQGQYVRVVGEKERLAIPGLTDGATRSHI